MNVFVHRIIRKSRVFLKSKLIYFKELPQETKMSTTHLATGSVEPPRIPGLMRLYIMEYCPYALRPRLVLKAKELAHDEVKINLVRKPEWYFKLHPEGKVPTLLDGENVIIESLDVSDYLESTYPQNPLYPSDPKLKAKDREIVFSKIDPAVSIFNRIMFGKTVKTPEEWLTDIIDVLKPLENELEARGTLFFGGDKPMMVDFMLWPWAECAEIVNMRLGRKLPIADNQLYHLRKWRKAMFNQPVCKALAHENACDKFYELAQCKVRGEEPNYDNLLGNCQPKL